MHVYMENISVFFCTGFMAISMGIVINFSTSSALRPAHCVIGYKIDEKYRRMGYGRRMLTMALKIMVTEYGMHRIEAYILPGNDASVNLARTMGFISEGSAYAYAKINKEWRDHLRFTYIT